MYLRAEAERRRAAYSLVDAEAVHGRALFDEAADGVDVHAVRNEDVNMLESLRVELGAYLLDQTGRYAAALGRGADIHAAQPVPERSRHIERFFGFVLECIDNRDSGDFEGQVSVV